ncbi:eCIS core domain-containing protein [Actinoplanes sp. CA-030573]|uniref:eCIS core domain-containing protein n=1 Tax=Actinoplanes sp. CA-030573 TaxID=3239898 RepID=UPI003D8A3678
MKLSERLGPVPEEQPPVPSPAPTQSRVQAAESNIVVRRLTSDRPLRHDAGLHALAGGGSRAMARLITQPKLSVSRPGDAYERQADAVADGITTDRLGSPPAISRLTGPGADAGEPPETPPGLEQLIASPGTGAPIPPEVRARIEQYLGVPMAGVRVHADPAAQRAAAQLGARAFTAGGHIFLGAGESAADLPLMAHEATHVAQQQVGVFRDSGGFLSGAIADLVRTVPGYDMLTVVAGYDPIANRTVERNPESLTRGVLGLVPFGSVVANKLIELGVVQGAYRLLDDGLRERNLTLQRIQGEVDAAWKEIDLTDPEGAIAIVRRHVSGLYADALSFVRGILDAIVQLIRDAAVGLAEKYLVGTPVWELAKKVLHFDPLRGTPVEASTVEIIADFLTLIGKQDALAQMRERGTLQKTADWLDARIAQFLGILGELSALFRAGWEAIQPANIAQLGDNLAKLAAQARGLIARIGAFASEVLTQVVKLIKDALLDWLSSEAGKLRGYRLMTVILGQDPVTGKAVPRTAENLIGGFIALLPGGEATYQKLAEAGVIAEAAAKIEGAMSRLGISVDMIVGTFRAIWDSLSLEDLVNPLGAFVRILERFGEPLGRIVEFAGEVLKVVVTLILRLMNFPPDLLGSIIDRAMAAIEDIKRDPVAFLMNMLEALKQGFLGFIDRAVGYLLDGLADWIFRGLGKLGIQKPPDLSFRSILTLVLQVLDVTAEKLWKKLGDQIGHDVVDKIRKGLTMAGGAFDFVKDVQENGVAAIWKHVEGQLGNLWDMLLGMVKDWIVQEIVEKATVKLLSMLDPTGIMAVVNSGIAFFKAVQSVIDYVREILMIVNDYVTTLAAIAAGNVTAGAQKVEKGLAAAVPVAIGFLANQVGLGDVPQQLVELIGGLRKLIDEALDWLFKKAVDLGKAALSALGLGGAKDPAEDESGPWDPPRVKAAAKKRVVERLKSPHERHGVDEILAQILAEYSNRGLVSLSLGEQTEKGIPVIAVASPPEELVLLAPPRRAVRMVATLKVTGNPLAGVTPQPGRHWTPETGWESQPAALPPTTTEGKGGTPRSASGGFLFAPEAAEPDTIQVLTWNTGELDWRVTSNGSHAEPQFVQWATKPENRQLLARAVSLTIDMFDWNPCAPCAEDLNRVRFWMPQSATATLCYREAYPGTNGIPLLTGAGWSVTQTGANNNQQQLVAQP